ncbi:MAG: hypothetical protein QXK94_01695 [Candidatus Jordarchaeales archaeon]
MPREWVKKSGLAPNDEVEVMENPDGTLLIVPSPRVVSEQTLTATIDIQKYPNLEHLKYAIETKYLSGYDVINIVSKQPFTSEKYNFISEVAHQLLGFEITSKTPNQVTLQDVMSIQQTNIMLLIRVLSRNVLELMEELIKALQKKDLRVIDAILQSRMNINRYYLRITRQLRKGLQQSFLLVQMGVTAQDTIDMVMYVNALNEIAGNIEAMCRAMQRHPLPDEEQLKEVADILQKVYEVLQQATRAFHFKKDQDAIEVLTVIPKLITDKRTLEGKLGGKISTLEGLMIQVVLDAGEKIAEATKSIAQAALRRAI